MSKRDASDDVTPAERRMINLVKVGLAVFFMALLSVAGYYLSIG